MAAGKQTTIGIAHPTVVPTNFEPEPGDRSPSGGKTADGLGRDEQ